MKNKRICFFIDSLSNSGGTERVTTVIANALSMRGFDITIVTIKNFKKPFFNLNPNIPIVSIEKNNFKNKFFKQFYIIYFLRRFLKSKSFDFIISVDSLLAMYSLPASFFSNVSHISWEQFNFKIDLGVWFRKITRQISGVFSDRIIVLSKKDLGYWNQGLFLSKASLSVIYNPSPYAISDLYYNVNSKNVLCVGRLTKQKGFDLILKVWPEILKRCPTWNLTIVGDGEERENLINLTSQLNIFDSVNFINATQNIGDLFLDASIFCLPSRFEGFGLVAIEAISFGLPIVAFDCDCGPSEIVSPENGFLVESDKLSSLSSALISMMEDDDLRISMSRASKSVAEKFMIDKVVNDWEWIFQNDR